MKVSLPALTVSTPADGAVITCAVDGTGTCHVQIAGTGADTTLGAVIAADGDGRFFVELPGTLAGSGGAFSGTVMLDYGRHVLKVFQSANGLDGDGVRRTIVVRPPGGLARDHRARLGPGDDRRCRCRRPGHRRHRS